MGRAVLFLGGNNRRLFRGGCIKAICLFMLGSLLSTKEKGQGKGYGTDKRNGNSGRVRYFPSRSRTKVRRVVTFVRSKKAGKNMQYIS